MGAKVKGSLGCEHAKEMIKLFSQLEGKHSLWPLWCDFVTMTACNLAMIDPDKREKRGEMCKSVASKYSEKELEVFAKLLACVVNALDKNPSQDFLGELYMRLDLGSDRAGQHFTPYNVCLMMGKMQAGNPAAEIAEKGYITVNDCCCGAGALLIGYANAVLEAGVNYQEHVLFAGQDIDFLVAMMCYIQLSLLGCAGYVIVGDSLSQPVTDPPNQNHDYWYTPMYFSDTWHWRRAFEIIGGYAKSVPTERITPKAKKVPATIPNDIQLTDNGSGQLAMF